MALEALSSAISAVSSLCSSAFSAVAPVVSTISRFVANIAPRVVEAISTVANIVEPVAKTLNVVRPTDKLDDLGNRALHAGEAGIKPESFANFDEYVDAIRNFDISIDNQDKFTDIDKKVAGVAITAKMMEEKFDLNPNTMSAFLTFITMNSNYFNPIRLVQWFNAPTLDKDKVAQLFEGILNLKDGIEINKEIIAVEKSNNPEKTELELKTDLVEAINSTKEA